MLFGGSFFYAQKVRAEQEQALLVERKQEETLKAQALLQAQLTKINIEQERQLAELHHATLPALSTSTPTVATIPKKITPRSIDQTLLAQQMQQAELARKQAASDALKAQQIEEARLAVEQEAQAQAALAAASRPSRRSRAS